MPRPGPEAPRDPALQALCCVFRNLLAKASARFQNCSRPTRARLAALFVVALAIAACGPPVTGSGSSDVPQGSGLYGTVKWPDGKPVPGGHLDFYPQGLTDPYGITIIGPAGKYFQGQTDTRGVYNASTVCNGVKCLAL